MSSRIALIADGRLILADPDGTSKRHECTFGEEIESRAQRLAEKNAWKTQGDDGGAMFPRAGLWGQSGGQPSPRPMIVAVCGGEEPESMVYSLWTGVVGAFLEYDFTEDYERRVFHKEDFHAADFDRHPVSGRLICRHGDDMISNLAVLDPNGRNIQTVTEGDSIDGSPSWVPGEKAAAVYHSAGVSRDGHGYMRGLGSFLVEKINLRNGEIITLVSDPHQDFLAPRMDGDGNLFFIRRPYEGPGGRRPGLLTTLKDVLLFPFRLGRAIIDFAQVFSQLVSRKPLSSAGGPKTEGPEPTKMWLHGRLMDAEKAAKESGEDGVFAPANWVLVKRTKDGSESVLAKRVLAFDLSGDGRIICSDGKNLRLIDAKGTRKLLAEPLTSSVKWIEA